MLQDIIDFTDNYNKEGALLFLDFKKAFDSLEWSFLHKVIQKFNFGPNFQKWVNVFYKDPQAVIKNNGQLSEPFTLTRGVRQGCPLSALLFIFVVEILANKIRSATNINGLTLQNRDEFYNYRISQYADDSVVILNNFAEIPPILELLDKFGELAGLRINVEKTKIIGLGPLKNRVKNVHNVEVVSCIKTLGIYVGHDKHLCTERNWSDKIMKMKILLQRWQERQLTLLGKVTIIKSLALPIISYSISNCNTPPWAFKNVSSLFFKFLWNGSEKVKRRSIIGKSDQGGLNMIDVEGHFKAIKASWVKRLLLADKSASWFYLPAMYLNKLHIRDTIHDINSKNITENEHFKILPNFYKEVIESFIACNVNEGGESAKCIIELCIWGNKKIVNKQDKVLYFPKWIECGIIKVKDLQFINNKIDESSILSRLHKKTNYISEIYQIKHAINVLAKLAPKCIQNTCDHKDFVTKERNNTTKQLYEHFVQNKFESPTGLVFLKQLSATINISKTYTIKLRLIKDRKICEFNYKLLNNCLPCKTNLVKWNIVPDSQCNYCGKEETAEHMLLLCLHKFQFWRSCLNILCIKLSPGVMFMSSGSVSKDWCISVVQYCIYKVSLMNSDKVLTSFAPCLSQVFILLNQFHDLYNMNNYTEVCLHLKNLLNFFNK